MSTEVTSTKLRDELVEYVKFLQEIGSEEIAQFDCEKLLKIKITEVQNKPKQSQMEPHEELAANKNESESADAKMDQVKIETKPTKQPKSVQIKTEVYQPKHNLAEVLTLEQLENIVQNDLECPLKMFANKTVFSDGIPTAKVMLIGEAPGEDEDTQGKPFVGRSGQLLDKALISVGLSRRTNVYITNTVFWRPPGNRKPTDEELEICKPYLERHISLVNPDILVLVGGIACQSILKTTDGITKLKSSDIKYINPFNQKEIPTFAIFHPSYLLRSPGKKKDVYLDLLKIRSVTKSV